MLRFARVLSLLACLASSRAAAQAPEQQGCNEDYVAAQRTRKEGKLLAAREHLIACTRELCMDVIEKDCAGWLGEVEASIPSVVVVARDAWGDETLEARVLVDGKVAREVLDANAIQVDPGEHVFRFETMNATPVEQTLIVREGEQNRRIEVQFGGAVPAGGPVDTEMAPAHDEEGGGIRMRDLAWVLGGAGAMSVLGGTLFWISSAAAEGDLEDSGCKPGCDPELTDGISRQRVIGDVMLGVGVVSVGAAVYLLVWGPAADEDETAATRLDVYAGPHGGGAVARGRF